ncbi:hypothetical protein SCUCBS95973_009325 [Sporothrix curviconia]|uniref:USP domain-containing protein n=1 Tax=Sporothrix curviconia TaxID=1260050 RepID=A0ABP0CU06_9PEZI
MDRESRSPEIESNQRAGSPEPSGTRLNPFKDGGESLRKRRRTSLSSSLNIDSRSRSAESKSNTSSPRDASHAEPAALSSPSTIGELEDSAMAVDDGPASSVPHTPENNAAAAAADSSPVIPAESAPSHVTLSLRNSARHTLDTIPSSSPPSPTPSGRPQGQDVTITSVASTEESPVLPPQNDAANGAVIDVDLIATPPAATASAHKMPDPILISHSGASSPPIEVVDIVSDDEDGKFASADPQVTILSDDPMMAQDMVLPDPTGNFPYMNNGELSSEVMILLMGPLTQAAFFVEFDIRILEQSDMADAAQSRETISAYYLIAMSALTKRDTLLRDEDRMDVAFGSDDISSILDHFTSFHQTEKGGTLSFLSQLLELQVAIMPTYPKISESFSTICCVASFVTREAYRNIARAGYDQRAVDLEKDTFALNTKIFDDCSAALDTAIANHITALSHDNVSQMISALGDMAYIRLKICEEETMVYASTIEESYPMPIDCVADAFSMKWRFSLFCRLIKNSQMQLRLMGTTNLCQELVGLWRSYGDQAQEHLQDEAILRYAADILMNAGLVAYMLGPTCHPEITAESSNVIGFLAVTRTYTSAHTDLFWQTVTTTQDPRIAEALIRTVSRIVNLFSYDAAVYLCRGFLDVPIGAFTSSMREFCEAVLRHVCSKVPAESESAPMGSVIPFNVCLHLLRESSVPSAKAPVAYPDVQSFAIDKLGECLRSVQIDLDQRKSLYQTCLLDLTQQSQTTLGSLCAIHILNRHHASRDLAFLTAENNLTKLVIDELEHALQEARKGPFPAVINGTANAPRRDVIFSILHNHPDTLTPELSLRLWEMMAGPAANCKEDRNASWNILNLCARHNRQQENNPFLTQCLAEFLPNLPPSCFCELLLDFLRERLLPLLDDISCGLFDVPPGTETDQESKVVSAEVRGTDHIALEQLWRIVLTAPPNTIERAATHFLVNDIYLESRCIQASPLQRSRRTHLALVSRCLRQLSSAASTLPTAPTDTEPVQSPADKNTDGELASSSLSESVASEQEMLFIRSLKVLQEFLRLYRASAHFSVPNIRPYIPASPKSVQGDSAELKYQSFDGDSQTEVKPLNIGRQNTAASLLASLKEVTGFENYRIFYRGKAFTPNGVDICRSLDDLRIHNGLILVKRDTHPNAEAGEGFVGGSPVEYEITRHFKELWEYLSMNERLSREIHEFLSQLPTDEEFLGQFDKSDLAYTDVFYIGQPYKSLYSLHALQQYLDLRRQPAIGAETETETEAMSMMPVSNSENSEAADTQMQTPDSSDVVLPMPDAPPPAAEDPSPPNAPQTTRAGVTYSNALATATRLVTSAICDTRITGTFANAELQIQLNTQLLKMLGFALSSPEMPASSCKYLNKSLLDCLMDILSTEFQCDQSESTLLMKDAFTAVMNACSLSREFWDAFREHEKSTELVERLLFRNGSLEIRRLAESHIGEKIGTNEAVSVVVAPSEFREFFWPIVLGIVPLAINEPAKCEGVFNLADTLFQELFEANSTTLDVATLLRQVGDLLSSCTTSEDITQPDCADYAMFGLTRLFRSIYRASQNLDLIDVLPANFVNRLFWKHLFPPWRSNSDANVTGSDAAVAQASCPRIVVNSQTRALLMNVIFDIVDDDIRLLPSSIRNLDQLVPCEKGEDDELYHYELPSIFERSRALRAPCGYVGLVNLSNTCYFNSLFTQLFMNVPFRQFMMNVQISDENNSQSLLFQTRVLFGFLQDSIRRYVDTQLCVSSIKTYDDTLIDIHNQMDVDEFYNLLFDRWESQLLSEDDKKAFRSFFGGHIVQQVRSKECEHVSERLEPFSAIQCDIKGKANLQESLEAYVEGEVMEGDNKYNCSSCDRHVDAIKRACLKDIPDHLILHLKRFDFNLRTLQRSKINDYFSFPHEIDMRPYTIDQLSNPTEEQTPDIFELVGVLVHSGTAESGHYYSYIRERPSSKTDESWFEFNDDTVSTWDHSLLESMCFGGSDSRSFNQYDANSYGLSSDKVYSAYMLFYQRSSSLAQEQELLAQSGTISPAKATMPTALFNHIHSENTSMVRRHALYDPQHIPFASRMLGLVQFARTGGRCSDSHKLENLTIQMALSHLDQVAARTKDIPDFSTLLSGVAAMGKKCSLCSLAIFDYFDSRPEIFRQMVQRSADPSVRVDMGQLLITSLTIIKKAFPRSYRSVDDESDMETDGNEDGVENVARRGRTELIRTSSILHGAAYMMQTLWEHFHLVTRSWPEVFSFMEGFVNMGREELGMFLDLEGLRRAILTISLDSSFTNDAQFSRLVLVLQRRNRPPSYESLISLIRSLLTGMYPLRTVPRSERGMHVDNNTSRLVLAQEDVNGDIPMSRYEYNLMGRDWDRDYGNVFVDKLISLDQNPLATDAIIVHLMATHPAMERKVFTTLKANIASGTAAVPQPPFLRTAQVFIQNAKSVELAAQMMTHVAQQCRDLEHSEGRAYFETLRNLYYGNTGPSGEIDVSATIDGLIYLPVWVPGLLCYFDTSVSLSVETFLQDEVFCHGPDPEFDDEEGGLERARMLKSTAKRLGVEMLQYIHLAFVQREIPISYSIASVLQRLILECTPFYAPPNEETDDELTLDFRRLSAIIPNLLNHLIVDDIEEDGSVGDSVVGDTSMQTAGEKADVDMP